MTKTYAVKEIFGPTLQGEGSLTGTPTWFVRFAGCNMWDGRPETRAASACPYCDTDFFGGTQMTAEEIDSKLMELGAEAESWITLSGGEPLLQVDKDLLEHLMGFRIAVETNGTVALSFKSFGWINKVIMSPKVPRGDIKLTRCDDIKVLYPHPNPAITPEAFEDYPAECFYIQPVNHDEDIDQDNLAKATEFCLNNPQWGLSVQLHKLLRIP